MKQVPSPCVTKCNVRTSSSAFADSLATVWSTSIIRTRPLREGRLLNPSLVQNYTCHSLGDQRVIATPDRKNLPLLQKRRPTRRRPSPVTRSASFAIGNPVHQAPQLAPRSSSPAISTRRSLSRNSPGRALQTYISRLAKTSVSELATLPLPKQHTHTPFSLLSTSA